MVLEEFGRNVLLNGWSPSAPRPASYRATTHGAFCLSPLQLSSGCRVRRGTSAVSKGTGSTINHKGNKSSRGPQRACPPLYDWLGPSSICLARSKFVMSSGLLPFFFLPNLLSLSVWGHFLLTGSDQPCSSQTLRESYAICCASPSG